MKDDIPSYVPASLEEADEAQAEWLRQGEFGGRSFRDFIPPGAMAAIGRLIDHPTLNWPWPYSHDELAAILSTLPEAQRDASAQKIVYAVRVYLAKTWAGVRGPKGKPSPVEELRNLKTALDKLLGAIQSLSHEADKMLRERKRLHIEGAPDMIRLRYTVDAFLHEHRLLQGLPEPLKIDRRGIKAKTVERELQVALDRIWLAAFGGVKPKRGFPAFEKFVLEPLKGWIPHIVTGKSRQDLRRSPDRSTRQRRIKQQKSDI